MNITILGSMSREIYTSLIRTLPHHTYTVVECEHISSMDMRIKDRLVVDGMSYLHNEHIDVLIHADGIRSNKELMRVNISDYIAFMERNDVIDCIYVHHPIDSTIHKTNMDICKRTGMHVSNLSSGLTRFVTVFMDKLYPNSPGYDYLYAEINKVIEYIRSYEADHDH